MKKPVIFLIVWILAVCAGCGRTTEKSPIENAVQLLGESDYEYRKISTKTVEGEEACLVMEGKIIQSPYQEYRKVIESTGENMVAETYFYGNGDPVNVLVKENDEWKEAKAKRQRWYGYGEKLAFSFEGETEIDGRTVEVYAVEYHVNLSKNFKLKEELEAVVTQTYYMDQTEKTLTAMETDLTDLNRKAAIAGDMANNGTSLEQAQAEKAAENYSETERIEFWNYGGDLKMELPKKTE